jgi:hypothetical protein
MSTRVPQQDPFAGGHSGELDGRRRSASSEGMYEVLVGAGVSAVRQELTSQRNGLHALGGGDDRICVDHGLTGTNRISKQSPASALAASQWAGKLQRRAQNSSRLAGGRGPAGLDGAGQNGS